jgi:hypothetical protein
MKNCTVWQGLKPLINKDSFWIEQKHFNFSNNGNFIRLTRSWRHACFNQNISIWLEYVKEVKALKITSRDSGPSCHSDMSLQFSVRQHADICLFSTAQYKCPVATLDCEDGFPVGSSCNLSKVYSLTPLLSNNKVSCLMYCYVICYSTLSDFPLGAFQWPITSSITLTFNLTD